MSRSNRNDEYDDHLRVTGCTELRARKAIMLYKK